MGRRSVLVAGGWLGAVVLAVLVGVGAINVIGAGLTSAPSRELTPADVARELSAAPAPPAVSESPSPSASASTTPSAGPSQGPSTAKQTRGGTVVVRCTGNLAEIVTMSPAAGFRVHEKDRGPQQKAEGEFRSSSDNHDRVDVDVTCAGGTPDVSWSNDD